MTHTYKIDGMNCGKCAAKVKSALLTLPDVLSADVDKPSDTATIQMERHIPLATLEAQLQKKDPKYHITPIGHSETAMQTQSVLTTYKPILLVFFYITLVTLLVEWASGGFDVMRWMRHFMAGFFLVFSFFKMLDLSGFADSYSTYDIVAKRWRGWAFVYAFIELFLGLCYPTNAQPVFTNALAFTVMTVSIIGVLQSVLNKQKIQCACLGAVFNLPMSTVTIIEDALMIVMSGAMLWHYLS